MTDLHDRTERIANALEAIGVVWPTYPGGQYLGAERDRAMRAIRAALSSSATPAGLREALDAILRDYGVDQSEVADTIWYEEVLDKLTRAALNSAPPADSSPRTVGDAVDAALEYSAALSAPPADSPPTRLDPVTHEDPAYARGWNDALDSAFADARRRYVRSPGEGADSVDVAIADVLTDLEYRLRAAPPADSSNYELFGDAKRRLSGAPSEGQSTANDDKVSRADLRAQVEALPKTGLAILGGADMVDRAAVLALLRDTEGEK